MTGPEAVGTNRLGRAGTNSTSNLLKINEQVGQKCNLSTYMKIFSKTSLSKGPDLETYTFDLFLTNCGRGIN